MAVEGVAEVRGEYCSHPKCDHPGGHWCGVCRWSLLGMLVVVGGFQRFVDQCFRLYGSIVAVGEVVVVLLGLFFTNLGCSGVFRVFVPPLSVFSKCTCRSW